MKNAMRAIEVTGTVDDQGNLHLDGPVTLVGPSRVRVIILASEDADFDESEWLRAASSNPVFDFLNGPNEDIYSPTDGKPFNDQG